ncbi:DNA polymerase III subunit beta [Vibrio sp. 1180_3]|uniref:DNA polymerase III subunit beta n=1 Tax=Vibrio sp. 1180_3 TaxID=2528832 RepID=UPI0024070BC8|nr:DNA polymerase III subunit beta [Vibrio sp. 1180_3]
MKIKIDTMGLLNAVNFISINEHGYDQTTFFIDQAYVMVTPGQCVLMRYGLNIEKQSMIVGCDSTESLTFQVNYEAFKGIVHNIAKRFSELELCLDKKNTLTISAGRLKTELKLTQLTPSTNELDPEAEMNEMSIKVKDFERILRISKAAAAKGDIRYYLNGVCLNSDETGVLRSIGTDGHRLSISKCSYRALRYEQHQIILSNDAVSYIEGILKLSPDEDVCLKFSRTSIRIKLSTGAYLNSKVIDASYPDWRRVVPMSTKSNVTFRKDELMESLKSAMPMTNPKFRGGKLSFKNNTCGISASNDLGSYEDEIEVAGNNIANIDIGFNLEYLVSALNAMVGPSVVLGFNDGGTAATIIEAENPSGVQVVMPVRI